jgi:hypothetical protein
MYTEEDRLKMKFVIGVPSNYYASVKINFESGQPYLESITLLDTDEVVISTWIHTTNGVKEECVQKFYPTERDWKLIKEFHGKIVVGKTHTAKKVWRGRTRCNCGE